MKSGLATPSGSVRAGSNSLYLLLRFALVGSRLRRKLVSPVAAPAREAGFTLVEVIVALAILSASLSVLLGMISGGLIRTSSAERMAEAGSLTQSLLAEVGTRYPLGSGERAGEFGDKYHWHLKIRPAGGDQEWEQRPVGLYEVSANIEWEDGGERRSFQLDTLRVGPKVSQR